MSGGADAALLAEQCVLGGLLLDNSARARLNGLSGEHFSVERHRTIYEAILDQIEDGEQGAAHPGNGDEQGEERPVVHRAPPSITKSSTSTKPKTTVRR